MRLKVWSKRAKTIDKVSSSAEDSRRSSKGKRELTNRESIETRNTPKKVKSNKSLMVKGVVINHMSALSTKQKHLLVDGKVSLRIQK